MLYLIIYKIQTKSGCADDTSTFLFNTSPQNKGKPCVGPGRDALRCGLGDNPSSGGATALASFPSGLRFGYRRECRRGSSPLHSIFRSNGGCVPLHAPLPDRAVFPREPYRRG